MDIKFKSVLLFFINLLNGSICSQVTMDSVLVSDTKPYIFHHQEPDYSHNDTLTLSTGDFLMDIQGAQLQMNTPGGLMTLLHRGMGNRHLPILWHGVNLQSIVNGSYDLTLIPLGLMDEISFHSVGNPALLGNNGFAGALNMKEALPPHKRRFKVYSSASSLQNYTLGLKHTVGIRKWNINSGIEIGRDHNIFSYTFNNQQKTRAGTDFNKINAIFNADYYISPRSYVTTNLWWQTTNRNIPVSVSSAPLDQTQQDENRRAHLSYSYFFKHHLIKTNVAFTKERLDYMAPGIDSRANQNMIYINAEWSQYKNKDYFIALSHRRDKANPNFYTKTRYRNTTQLSLAKKINLSHQWVSDVAMRQDLVDNKWMPVSVTVQSVYKKLTLLFARNYNLPGFNDLYWPSGGNPDLKPELSLQAELKSSFDWYKWNFSIASYGQLVDDWIQWLPQASGLWSPSNVRKVLSRGGEIKAKTKFSWQNIKWEPTLQYACNRTSATEHLTDPDLIGKQLIYIPIHKAGLQLASMIKENHLTVSYQWTGQRYDVSDQSQALDPIHLLDLKYARGYKKLFFQVGFNNLLNSQYQYVRFFPMPRLNVDLKITYNII